MRLGLLVSGLRSYGVVLWEIITGERPDKLRGLRAPECAHLLSIAGTLLRPLEFLPKHTA